ncbi:putative secreted protein (Por secretion system target) [Dyadobacter jejuensis]|uniref:Putative secreted protein (Por secretion system target) n=2 Tax=Dyadobacter jejuensis TaxID=1082580 RepID=A0A316AHI7_9BACT|nr:putative secreted protein (Por secretion system target) [Dyadobacter jejuensis]
MGPFALAQSTQSGSRLNMGTNKKAVIERVRFNNGPKAMDYKPLSLQKPKTLNSFYRSLFFSSDDSERGGVMVSEISESNVERKSAPIEMNTNGEEQLFSNELITVSNVYPNPASEYAELDFTIQPNVREAKVIFYSILGSQMQEYNLKKSDRKIRINTREMPTGLYFYQLSLDGKKVATKKMLVRHQQ